MRKVSHLSLVPKAPAPVVVDDLTRLVGIGPKLAAALAERGVTAFAQIAAWTEAELAEIDAALNLRGRAVRDDWVGQAKRFAAGG
jgi:predicted flap endonuclease-1-like 5' DNA nuclease